MVTGGNRGIGLELVRQLAADGFAAILGSRDPGKGEAAAAPLRSEGLDVEARQLDVADDASVSGFAAGLDRLDVLVNNAAIHYDTWESGVDADLGVAREAFETNVLGAWRMTQACLPTLRALRERAHRERVERRRAAQRHGRRRARLSRHEGGAQRAHAHPGRASCAPTASSSTRCARAGWPPTWAAPAGGRWRTARRA